MIDVFNENKAKYGYADGELEILPKLK